MIVDAAKENNLEIKYIIITHGHIDHLMSWMKSEKDRGGGSHS